MSTCEAFVALTQLSQASPTPSASPSLCVGFATVAQLSRLPQIESRSGSFAGSSGHGSQTSPEPSRSMSDCPAFATAGQLSVEHVLTGKPGSPRPSASVSVQASQASPPASWSALACPGL